MPARSLPRGRDDEGAAGGLVVRGEGLRSVRYGNNACVDDAVRNEEPGDCSWSADDFKMEEEGKREGGGVEEGGDVEYAPV